MTGFPQILADTNDSIVKVLFGVVFLIIWGVSALMSVIAKKKEQERRERVRREIETGRSVPPPMRQGPASMRPPMQAPPRMQPAPPRPVQPRPVQHRPPPLPQKQVRKRFPVKAPVARQPAIPASAFQSEPAEAVILEASHAAATPRVNRRPSNAPSAAALHSWLKPATLRQQFILTEVLQPPVAMREQHVG
jgi:hypothetical protein